MTVKQLSVFIENRPGRLSAVTKILGDNDVNTVSYTHLTLPTKA